MDKHRRTQAAPVDYQRIANLALDYMATDTEGWLSPIKQAAADCGVPYGRQMEEAVKQVERLLCAAH